MTIARKQRTTLNGTDSVELHIRPRKHLSRLVAGRNVVIAYNKRDRYGRIVGALQLSGQDINLNQVEAGMAWHYKKYQKEQSQKDRENYSAAEGEARKAKRGLWREPNPTPPWEWRRIQRDK